MAPHIGTHAPDESDVSEQLEVESDARALSHLSRVAVERPAAVATFGH